MTHIAPALAVGLMFSGCSAKDDRADSDSGVTEPPECTEAADCTDPTAPVCNEAGTCEACNEHADCSSHACDLGTGACLDEATIAYVADGGAGTAGDGCLLAAPCASLVEALGVGLPIVKFEGTGQVEVDAEQTIDVNVRILADRGARLRRIKTTGPVVNIVAERDVTIEDLEIREGTGDAIVSGSGANLTLDRVFLTDNGGRGVNVLAGGSVVIRRSVISGNNQGGVSVADAHVEFTNNMIVRNGAAGSTVGGVRSIGEDDNSFIRFNTIAHNLTDPSVADQAAVNCDRPLAATSNIVVANTADSECLFDHSLFDGGAPAGEGNTVGDPAFAATDPLNATDPDYYRITAGSLAIDRANPDDPEVVDIDGDPRPQGDAKDIGADEFVE